MTEFIPPNLSNPALFYTGVHWDGSRHSKLMNDLRAKLPVSFYGDPAKWAHYGAAYKGAIPFDGVSIFEKINSEGVVLCLHRDEHLKHDLPSMRIFEAAAAGAVIITEKSNFAQRHFGGSALYVDQDASVAEKVAQISAHFAWICSHQGEALAMASQSHAIFNANFALEKLLAQLPEFLQQVKRANYYEIDNTTNTEARVDVIVRVGGRGLAFIERCLDSLAAQNHINLGLVLVSYREVPGLDGLLEKYANRFTSIKRIASEPTGFRSTALWDGMRAIDGKYFCNLDDDDTLHPNHISSLVALLESDKEHHVAYSGWIQIQDEDGHYYRQANHTGPLGKQIKENRHLFFFDQFKRRRLLQLDNYVGSNAYLARTSLLEERDLVDPKLKVAEDVYLFLLFLRRSDFLFSWRATANWHWRTTSEDNSMMLETCHSECGRRVLLRTQFFYESPDSITMEEVLKPFVSHVYTKLPRVKMLVRHLKKWLRNGSG
ncbi:glycosyltransferase [Sulfuricella denitrificans]|uniref:glycosyltransferase n=1 Tax=Sulfuricella denitrificans TaxID=649841 RepID=UPI001376DC4D|nr:glycosyltransferase family 2 protein [Sulfuricella denitrificans]